MMLAQAGTSSGVSVTPLKALGVATVFACVRVMSDTLSTLPLLVRQVNGRNIRMATEHRLYNALRLSPNTDMTSADARAAIQSNLSLTCTGYAEILRDGDGDAVGFYPIETGRCDPYWEQVGNRRVMRYRVSGTSNRGSEIFEARDILHLKTNSYNGHTGMALTTTVRECIALALAIQDNGGKFFGNGSRPSGVLEHPMTLSKEAQQRLVESFEKETSGENLYRTKVLEEGLKYSAVRSENKDSQFLESKDAQNLEICRVFGVPPHKAGILAGQPRASIEEENIAFITDIVRPCCVRWEQQIDMKMFTPEELDQGYGCYFDMDALARGDIKSRATAVSSFRQWGIWTANDARARENLPAIEGGDTLLQPINMIDATKATEYLMANKKQPAEGQPTGGTPV